MSKVVVTLEFLNIAEATEAFRRMLGSSGMQAQIKVEIPTISLPASLPNIAGDAQSLPSTTTPAVVLTEKPVRKPRSDAGQPRGPHKDPAAPAQPVAQAQEAQRAEPAASTAADPNVKLTKEDATAALGRMNKIPGLGMPACIEHLKLFGVNRISILPEKDFALFIKQADEKIAEHAKAQAAGKLAT